MNPAGANGKKGRLFGTLPKNIVSLGWVSFFTDVSSEIIYPLLPIFLISLLGVGTTFLGLIEGIAEATASLLKLLSGWVSDRIRKRKALIVIGYSLSTAARPLVAAAMAVWHVLIVRFLDRLGKGIRTSPSDALVADSVPREEAGKAFGFQRSMDHAGAVAGPLLAFLFLTYFSSDIRLLFWLAAVPGVIAVLILIFRVRETKETPPQPGPQAVRLTLKPFSRNFKAFLFSVFLFTLGNSSDAFLILKAREAGIAVSLIPILWLFFHFVKSLAAIPGGILSDILGRKKTILSGWLLYSFVYLGFAAADEAWMIWALFGVYGVFFGLTEGGERALVADLVGSEWRGTAYGLYNFFIGIGALPASLIMGFLWERFNPQAAFLFGAFFALAAAFLLGLLVREPEKARPAELMP